MALLAEFFQYAGYQFGCNLNAVKVAAFFRRMNIEERWANRNHIQMGVLFKKSAAFQRTVNRFDDHVAAGQRLIDSAGKGGEPAFGIDGPGGRMLSRHKFKAESIGQCAVDGQKFFCVIGGAAAQHGRRRIYRGA